MATPDEELQALFNRVSSFLFSVLNTIQLESSRAQERIVGVAQQQLGTAIVGLTQVSNAIFTSIDRTTAAAIQSMDETGNAILDNLGLSLNIVFEEVNDAVRGVESLTSRLLTSTANVADTIGSTVSNAFRAALSGIGGIADSIGSGLSSLTRNILDSADRGLQIVADTLASVPDALGKAGTRVVDGLAEFVSEPLLALVRSFLDGLGDLLVSSTSGDAQKFGAALNASLFSLRTLPFNRASYAQLVDDLKPENPVSLFIFRLILAPLMVLQLGTNAMRISSRKIGQEANRIDPSELLAPADSIRAFHYGLISIDEVISNMTGLGFTTSDARVVIESARAIPSVGDLLNWKLRGFVDDESFNNELTSLGFRTLDRQNFLKSAFFIPPVQDLITMAVREVFTPEVAARFGQFEDFPTAFGEFAEQKGLTQEWSQNYWAAHWKLPSVNQGFRMLHRRVITEADLQLLLKSLDVMPFWRDRLQQIAFAPFTRVDIRRMHKLEILDEDAVNRAYRDIGYDEEKANRLTEFTLVLNGDKESLEPDEVAKLSRSAIIGFMTDGLLSSFEAKALLLALGMADATADLFITSAQMNEQREERKEEINLILARQAAGELTLEQAQDRFGAIGLETKEQSKAIARLNRQGLSRTRIPSKEDLSAFLKAGLIQASDFVTGLQRLGFSNEWSQKYLTLAQGK